MSKEIALDWFNHNHIHFSNFKDSNWTSNTTSTQTYHFSFPQLLRVELHIKDSKLQLKK